MCSKASCLGLGEPGDREMERSKTEIALVNGSHLTRRNGHGETSFRRRLPFRALHSSISGVWATATPLRAIRIAQVLSNTYLLRAAFRRSLSSVRPNEAKTYDAKQLIGVALATNRLTHGFRRHTGKYPRCLSIPLSGSALVRY